MKKYKVTNLKTGKIFERVMDSYEYVQYRYNKDYTIEIIEEKKEIKEEVREDIFKCSVCGKEYETKASLTRHMKKHIGEV